MPTTSAPKKLVTRLMWRVRATGSVTAIRSGLTVPLGARVTAFCRVWRRSAADWGKEMRDSASFGVRLKYQLNRGFPELPALVLLVRGVGGVHRLPPAYHPDASSQIGVFGVVSCMSVAVAIPVGALLCLPLSGSLLVNLGSHGMASLPTRHLVA
jgi:hypothetical protein